MDDKNIYSSDNNEGNKQENKQDTMLNGFSNYESFTNQEPQKEEKIDKLEVTRIVREEIKKNHKPKGGLMKAFSLVLVGAILGTLGTNMITSKSGGIGGMVGGTPASYTINTKGEVNVEKAVAEKTTPSVVGITTLAPSQNLMFQSGENLSEGVGSGVIISQDGYILTNSHVVRDGKAKSISVLFSDKTKVDAKLLWYDSTLDLAVIKVNKTGLQPAELGNSDNIEVGDKAIAIGNPLGLDLQSTLTSGYISGLNRSITMSNGMSMDGLVQTDAAINPGNSGGALLNDKGQLIGINTAKARKGEGLGFAIPINTVKPIVEKIIKTGNYQPVLLGISGIDVANYVGTTGQELPVNQGAIIMTVQEGSNAERAGLQKGDIITKLGETTIADMSQLRKALINYNTGDKTQITINRQGKTQQLQITFASK